MALSAKVGAFNSTTSASGTTIPITGLGFQPKAIIFWWSGITGTADAVSAASIASGLGFACGTTDRRCTGLATTASPATTSVTGRIQRNDACVATVSGAGSVLGLLDLSAIGADGFTMIVDDQFPTSVRVHYLALGGDTLTNASTGEFDASDATGTQQVTGVTSFQPDGLLMTSCMFGSSTQSTIGLWGLGAAVSSSQQAVLSVGSRNGVGDANNASYCLEGPECFAVLDATNANPPPVMRAAYTQSSATGFDLSWAEIGFTGTRLIYFLALQGVDMAIGSLTTQTDTVTDITTTGLGFQPSAVMFFSAARPESSADASSVGLHASIGAATSATERGAQAWMEENIAASGLMESAIAVEHDAVYINISTSDTVQGLMDLKSIDSNGFTCIMDDADPSGSFVWWMAFGEPGSGGGASTGHGILLLGVG
jgi:hypothetical protein